MSSGNSLGKGDLGGFCNSCVRVEDKLCRSVTLSANNFTEMTNKADSGMDG